MSERSLRRKFPVSNRRARLPHPTPSPHRQTPAAPRRSSRPTEILQSYKSEPTLWTVGLAASDDDSRNLTTPDAVLFRPQTSCTDIFSCPELLPPQSPKKFEGYIKDAKVVVNVTVEGSSGPIRTMIKLGTNVEDTIRLVINKYSEEGRSPRIDKDAASSFELHHSYFSLASLNKSDVIGDVGSRSFYLRRGNSDRSSSSGREMKSASFTSEIVPAARASTPPSPSPPHPPSASPLSFLPTCIVEKINKIIRRARKLWKILGCLHCS